MTMPHFSLHKGFFSLRQRSLVFVAFLLSHFLIISIFNFAYTNHGLVAIPVNWILPGILSIWSLSHITIQTTAALCPHLHNVGLSTSSPYLQLFLGISWCSSEYLEPVCRVPNPCLGHPDTTGSWRPLWKQQSPSQQHALFPEPPYLGNQSCW